MKNKLQIVWSSIAIISVCACSTPYTQPDAPIVAAVGKRTFGERFKSLSAHDDGISRGEGFETLQIIGKPE